MLMLVARRRPSLWLLMAAFILVIAGVYGQGTLTSPSDAVKRKVTLQGVVYQRLGDKLVPLPKVRLSLAVDDATPILRLGYINTDEAGRYAVHIDLPRLERVEIAMSSARGLLEDPRGAVRGKFMCAVGPLDEVVSCDPVFVFSRSVMMRGVVQNVETGLPEGGVTVQIGVRTGNEQGSRTEITVGKDGTFETPVPVIEGLEVRTNIGPRMGTNWDGRYFRTEYVSVEAAIRDGVVLRVREMIASVIVRLVWQGPDGTKPPDWQKGINVLQLSDRCYTGIRPDSTCTFYDVPPGKYMLSFQRTDHFVRLKNAAIIEIREDAKLPIRVDAVVEPDSSHTVSGTVVVPVDLRPQIDQTVIKATHERSGIASLGKIDNGNRFTILNVTEGDVALAISLPGTIPFARKLKVDADTDIGVVNLSALPLLRVSVTGIPKGVPLEQVQVEVCSSEAPWRKASPLDEKGAVAISVPPGRYMVSVSLPLTPTVRAMGIDLPSSRIPLRICSALLDVKADTSRTVSLSPLQLVRGRINYTPDVAKFLAVMAETNQGKRPPMLCFIERVEGGEGLWQLASWANIGEDGRFVVALLPRQYVVGFVLLREVRPFGAFALPPDGEIALTANMDVVRSDPIRISETRAFELSPLPLVTPADAP